MFLVVLGVCVGALGAPGFHTPGRLGFAGLEREPSALAFFGAGIAMLGSGGYIVRQMRRQTSEPGVGGVQKQAFVEELETIHAIVTELDKRKEGLSADEVRDLIGKLMAEEFFDLTSKSDDLLQLVGFKSYALVWDGVAIGERLLQRCWSMCTDGYPEQGIAELPLARAQLERAAKAMRSV